MESLRTSTVRPEVYTTLSFPALSLVAAPRVVTGFGGYSVPFLYDIISSCVLLSVVLV